MYKQKEIASVLHQSLRIIMGSSYVKYKKTAESMMFLNKAVVGMSRKELLALIGYMALKYGVMEQPVPQNQQKEEKGVKSDRKEENRDKPQETQRSIKTDARMASCRLG